ncbi:hypothetical protein MTR67_038332 [Solanum verrucosum]|uniref:Uncharacterized protein n=1 Tax=Solanum verrucosum TaxID=315347 RepID=A0AAF0UFA7_SOLVR|nr:hypothetical protein MTR67_038332 [Solanum verrucosum]
MARVLPKVLVCQALKEKIELTSHRTIPRCSIPSPNVTEPEFAEGQYRKTMNQTKRRITEWIDDPD